MKRTRSELDEVVCHLTELASTIGVTSEELSTFMRIIARASWAHVEFEPVEGVEFEFKAVAGGGVELEVRARRGNTTIIKEFEIPEFLIRRSDLSPQARRPRRRRARRRPGGNTS